MRLIRRRSRLFVAALVAAALTIPAIPARGIGRGELERRVASIRTQLDKMTTAMFEAEEDLDHAQEDIQRHTRALASADKRLALLGDVYSRRTAEMYMAGKGGFVESLTTSTSVDVFAERLGYLERLRASEMTSFESLVALKKRAKVVGAELARARDRAATALRLLTARRKGFDEKLREYQALLGLANLTSGRVAPRASRLRLAGFRCPVAGPHGISSNFGARRRGGAHQGIDLAASSGTPLVAVLPSRVVDVVYGGWMGRGVILRDSSGNEWWYAHMSSTYVGRGERVSAGEVVGRVGCTGNCTGPHLHFEYHPGGGAARNPFAIVRAAC